MEEKNGRRKLSMGLEEASLQAEKREDSVQNKMSGESSNDRGSDEIREVPISNYE